MLGGSCEAPGCPISEEAAQHNSNNTPTLSSLQHFARVQTQQVTGSITQLQDMARSLQEKLDTACANIRDQQSAESLLRCLSDRITILLDSPCQDRDNTQSDIRILDETLSRYRGLQLYRNQIIINELRNDQDEAVRGLGYKVRRARQVEGNIESLGSTIDLISRRRSEDQVAV